MQPKEYARKKPIPPISALALDLEEKVQNLITLLDTFITFHSPTYLK